MASNLLKKVTARVFASDLVGGNPVIVFVSKDPLPQELQTRLAQDCEWESVVVARKDFLFYMPSGEQVSFCAHAAMGAAYCIAKDDSILSFSTKSGQQTATIDDNRVGLHMRSTFTQDPIADPHLLRELLNMIQVKEEAIAISSLCNASVARPKTLVNVESVQALHAAQAPRDPVAFCQACDAIGSTGLFLYSHLRDNEYECRQFPRASGYPEDPATGIAAAALAVRLYQKDKPASSFIIHQGTAMGRPSLLTIQDIQLHQDNVVEFSCWGQVQVDKEETIQLG
jgi:PhzF family phenazine biosynthesis protein